MIPKRKSMWVYLSSRERVAVTRNNIESGEKMGDWIRNAVRVQKF